MDLDDPHILLQGSIKLHLYGLVEVQTSELFYRNLYKNIMF